jgi:hypothetical protein
MALSGQKTVTTAGAAEPLAAAPQVANLPIAVKALAGNSGLVYVGDSGVDASNGFELGAGEVIIFDAAGDLSSIWIDSAVNGEGVCWLVLNT